MIRIFILIKKIQDGLLGACMHFLKKKSEISQLKNKIWTAQFICHLTRLFIFS